MTVKKEYNEIVIQPQNAKKEATCIALAIGLITLLVAFRVSLMPGNAAPLLMRPYQRLDTTLPDKPRSMFQAILSAEGEIKYLWEEQKSWPDMSLLIEENIPPFYVDLLPPDLRGYSWKAYDRGPWIDYIAQDNAGDDNEFSFILRVIDLHAGYHPHPHPGIDYDPKQKIAMQIWGHPKNNQKYPGMQVTERGWYWFLTKDDPVLNPANVSDQSNPAQSKT